MFQNIIPTYARKDGLLRIKKDEMCSPFTGHEGICGSGVTSPLVFNLSTRWVVVVVVIFTPPYPLASLEVSPGTRRTGCCVYPRACLDFLVVGKSLVPVGNRTTVA